MIRVEVAIVGGGIGGSLLATVLQRRGWQTAVIEREAVFRDRVRGEGLHPWGFRESVALGVDGVIREAGANELPYWQSYYQRAPIDPWRWDDDPQNEYPEFALYHPALQNAAIAAAEAAGAIVLRPVSARKIEQTATGWTVHAERFNGNAIELQTDLLIGADGRESAVRGWLGISTTVDPPSHRFGGVLLEGVELAPDAVHAVGFPGGMSYLLPQGNGRARAYGGAVDHLATEIAADKTGGRLISLVRDQLPEGALGDVRAIGPLALFPNGDIVPERLTGPRAALIGDAAGANDPSVGQGLSLTLRDIRELSDLLEKGTQPQSALDEYGRRRSAYHQTVREHAKWIAATNIGEGAEFDARRAQARRAREADPTLGGFAFMYMRGPMELVADAAARAHFMGDDL